LCHALAVAGRRAGDEAMLQEAVEAGRRAVELVDRSRHPEQWIASHSSLGHALGALGELKGDAAMLREAIGLLEAGISVTEAKLPREGRSMLLQNIGSVRLSLARETSDDAILAQAVEELRGAFAAFEAAGLPYPWAQTARLLGDAVSESGDLREAAALYRNAIDCFDKGGANSQAEGTRAALERLGDMHGNRPPASHIPIYQVK
jgi:tetratricopeptide (TPR) repeat protein